MLAEMRTPLLLLGATMLALAGSAADLALGDGRVLRDATIRSQTPGAVVVRHADGLSSVDKKLLPPELQAQYPVDEAAALAAERQAALAQAKVQADQQARAERRARELEERRKNAPAEAAAQAQEAERLAEEQAAVKAGAISCARDYFLREYDRNAFDERTCEVTLAEVRPADGWTKRWFVRGQAVMRYYRSEPEQLMGREPPRPAPGQSAKAFRRAEADRRYLRTEMREFEAYYSTEGEKPSINVTLR